MNKLYFFFMAIGVMLVFAMNGYSDSGSNWNEPTKPNYMRGTRTDMAPKTESSMGVKNNYPRSSSIGAYRQSNSLSETQKIEGRTECAKQWDAVDKRDSGLNTLFMPAQAENSKRCKKYWN